MTARKSIYGVHPGVAYTQSVLDNLAASSGRGLEAWVAHLKKAGPKGAATKQLAAWLEGQGLGATQAALVAARATEGADRHAFFEQTAEGYLQAAEAYVEALYANKKAHLRPLHDALRKLGPCLVQYFGLGEVTGNITVLPPEWHSLEDDPAFPIGSCGYPRTGIEIAILDASHQRLGADETGEICVRGPAVMAGYFGNPSANEKAFAGGWFHTGDLGHLDSRGFLHITGRQSDMYIPGGSNVYPREVEEALLTHPDVAEACVLGVPGGKGG